MNAWLGHLNVYILVDDVPSIIHEYNRIEIFIQSLP